MNRGSTTTMFIACLHRIGMLLETSRGRLAAFTFITLIARLPSFFFYSVTWDEGAVLSESWAWSIGEVLYRDTWQIHPPLNFLIFVPFFKVLSGESVALVAKLLTSMASIAAAWISSEIIARFSSTPLAPLLTGALVVSHLSEWDIGSVGEIFFTPLSLVSLWLLSRPRVTPATHVTCGAIWAVGMLFKQTAVLDAVVIALGYLLLSRARGIRFIAASLVRFSLGGLSVAGVMAAYLYSQGNLFEAIHFLGPGGVSGYAYRRSNVPSHVGSVAFQFFYLEAMLLLLTFLVILLESWRRTSPSQHLGPPPPAGRLWLTLLSVSWIAVVFSVYFTGGSFFEHYLWPLCPPVAFLTVLLAERVGARHRRFLMLAYTCAAAGMVWMLAVPGGIWVWKGNGRSVTARRAQAVVEFVKARTSPGDSIFLYGLCELDVYYLAERHSPNGIYMFVDMLEEHTGDGDHERRMRDRFWENPPRLFLHNPGGCSATLHPSAMSFRDEVLRSGYRKIAVVQSVEMFMRPDVVTAPRSRVE